MIYQIKTQIKKRWYRLRTIDYTTTVGAHDEHVKNQAELQSALNHAAGTDSPEYKAYLKAHKIYAQKWYRFILREPKWVGPGGTIYLQPGQYDFRDFAKVSNTSFIGESKEKTTIRTDEKL